MVRELLLSGMMCAALRCAAQDTFYLKKKTPAPADVQPQVVYADTTTHDSVISYTCEYRKPGSNIWTVNHMKGPYLVVPDEVVGKGTRVLFTEIIAIDKNGKKYRMPDRYYNGGIFVDAPK